MGLRLFKSCVLSLALLVTLGVLSSTARAQESVSQTCANLGFKPGSRGHTDCVNQNSGGRVAPKPANPAPAVKAIIPPQEVKVQAVPELTAAQREDKFWDDAKAVGNREAYEGYLNSYPTGSYADLAKANLTSLDRAIAKEEDKFWEEVQGVGDKKSYQSYLDKYPVGRYVIQARAKLDGIYADEKARQQLNIAGVWRGQFRGVELVFSIVQSGTAISITRISPPQVGRYAGTINGRTADVISYVAGDVAVGTSRISLQDDGSMRMVVLDCFNVSGYSCAPRGSALELRR